MPLDVALRFQDAQFPLPPSARIVEPEPLRLKHPVVQRLSNCLVANDSLVKGGLKLLVHLLHRQTCSAMSTDTS